MVRAPELQMANEMTNKGHYSGDITSYRPCVCRKVIFGIVCVCVYLFVFVCISDL